MATEAELLQNNRTNAGITPIAVSDLQNPQSPIPFQSSNPSAPFDVSTIPLPQQEALGGTEKQAQDLIGQLTSLTEGTRGESAYRASQEADRGVPELVKAQRDLETRLKGLQNEALAIPLQLQEQFAGTGATRGGVQPIETSRLRNNAIQALSTASLLEASRGNLASAYDYVDRAVKQKFDPIKEDIAVKTANLNLLLNSPQFALDKEGRTTRTNERLRDRANQQLAVQAERERQVAKQEATAKEIYGSSLTALKYGAPADVVKKMQEAQSPEEAMQIGFQYLKDPKAKYELESARLDNVLKQANINKTYADIARTNKEMQLLGQPTAADIKEQKAALQSAKSAVPVMKDKITTIGLLSKHEGLNSRVGPTIAHVPLPFGLGFDISPGRIGVVDTLTSAGQDFAGGVHQLVNGLTIDELQKAKAQGATFGALSDGELKLLADSATKINDWEVKDDKGRGTGNWNISEKAFKEELANIQRLTQRALTLSEQSLLTDDEDAMLDDVYGEDSSLKPGSNYYN